MGKTIELFGFASIPSAASTKQLLEKHTGQGTVSDVKDIAKKASSRAHAIVEFTSTDAAETIKSLADELGLWHKGSYLKAWDFKPKRSSIPQRIDCAALHMGCQISKGIFSVLWSQDDVFVKFCSTLRKFDFFLSYNSVDYKLEVSYESIWKLQLCCPRDQSVQYLVFRLLGAPRIYEKDVHWVRKVDFTPGSCIGQSSALCVELKKNVRLPEFLKDFFYYSETKSKFSLQRGSPFSTPNSYDLVPIVNPPNEFNLPFKILFKINSLVQHGCIPGPSVTVRFFRLVDPSRINIAYIEHALEKLFHLKECCYEPVSWLRKEYKMYDKSPASPFVALDDGLVYVRKVLVTPSKVYFCGPEISFSNRILRSYPDDIDNFIRVSFVDEDLDRLYSTVLSPREERLTTIYFRILSVLRNGIVIGDKRFEFLACSNSQLKANSLWMFASRPGLTAADIRMKMGDFREIKNVAKYAARLGQSFSSSRETVNVPGSEMEIIPDVEIKKGGITYVFSDGIGKISAELAETVAKRCGFTSYTPSAFQIRYGGYKGVVAVDPTSSVKLSLRNSMCKYKSDSTSLDVLSSSRYQPCFLNRQLITLLSTLGIRDCVFERKQKEAVAQLNAIMTDLSKAYEALEQMCSGWESMKVLKEMLMCDYKPDREPFLSMMLQIFSASSLLELRTKTRIFVPKGQAMMGCLDETGTLDYGQVFVQYSGSRSSRLISSDNSSLKFSSGGSRSQCNIVEGKVVVAKNPCLHPGDMRVLRAVDVPALRHMVDCVVFPAKGKRPHTNECSGSDLDGDVYFVCWDPDLIPPHQFPPMDYNPLPTKPKDGDVTIEDVEEYFTDYIMNDTLGIICNAHVVFADKEPSKAMCNSCIDLAMLSSIAVDFSKTGVAAEIPAHLRVQKYPDFMEKLDKETYTSERVIGKLFREVRDIAPTTAPIRSFTEEEAMMYYDHEMEVYGFRKYLKDAVYHKNEYDKRLSNMMDYYGIKTEGEILSGYIMKMAKSFDKKRDLEAISFAVKSLRKEARAWFNKPTNDDDDDDDVLAKASAWYHVTYHPSYWEVNKEYEHFLSFPWCVHEKLMEIKKGKGKIEFLEAEASDD